MSETSIQVDDQPRAAANRMQPYERHMGTTVAHQHLPSRHDCSTRFNQ